MVMRILMMNMIDVLVTVVGSNLKIMVKMIPGVFNREWLPSQQGTSQRHLSQSEAVFGAFKHFHPFFSV